MIEIVAATPADLDAIDEIEQHSFKAPWPRATFEAELTRAWARLEVGRQSDAIVAFCNYWLVTTELHVLAIATHRDHRGHGIATHMLAHVLDAGRAAGSKLATLEVRKSSKPAIALYDRAGFEIVHVRLRSYQDDNEDALVMLRAL